MLFLYSALFFTLAFYGAHFKLLLTLYSSDSLEERQVAAVEAEVALAEINRLETLYHTNHGTYSGDVTAIGFS
ncbi:MAG TPA: hypothetical protein VFT30_11845, partial [Nitrospira sp.]|nr:hypothetical protein [Nitrospira sp.]